jgi:hypothetical protein
MTEPLFQDRKLEIYRDFLIIRDYYAPWLDKKLRISDIKDVWVENLTVLGGKYRLWCTGWFLSWFPFHAERSDRDKAVVVKRKSGLIRKTKITLDTQDPLKACELIHNLLR